MVISLIIIFFRNIDPKLGRGIKQAGHFGSRLGAAECTQRYTCKKRAQHYRFPGHAFSNMTVNTHDQHHDINDQLTKANQRFLTMMDSLKGFV